MDTNWYIDKANKISLTMRHIKHIEFQIDLQNRQLFKKPKYILLWNALFIPMASMKYKGMPILQFLKNIK